MGLFSKFIKGKPENSYDSQTVSSAPEESASSPKATMTTEQAPSLDAAGELDTRLIALDPETAGWDSIDCAFGLLYPNQADPLHFAPAVPMMLGGSEPLDGISVYDGGDFWHFVTYGLSELYEKQSDDPETSGFGMEFTFKLAKSNPETDQKEIRSICGVLQKLAALTYAQGIRFLPFQTIYTGQANGIDSEGASQIAGFITVAEDKVESVNTPNGRVVFTELVGATNDELLTIRGEKDGAQKLLGALGTDVTDLARESIAEAL